MSENQTQTLVTTDPIITALAKENITNQVILKFKEEYLGLKLTDLNDKETLAKLKEGRKASKDMAVLTEKICKKGREELQKTVKEWIAKEKEIGGEFRAIEDYCYNEGEGKVKAEEERIAIETAQAALKRREGRLQLLIDNGAVLNPVTKIFTLNHLNISDDEVTNVEDGVFNAFVEQLKTEYEKVLAEKKAFEEKATADAKALADQKAEQDRIAEEQRKEREQLEAEKKEIVRQKVQARFNILNSIGLIYHPQLGYQYESIRISHQDIVEFDDATFSNAVEAMKVRVVELKAEEEENRKKREEELKQQAIKDEELRKENEHKEKERLAALAPDRDKLVEVQKYFHLMPVPTLSSPEANEVLKQVAEKSLAIVVFIGNEIEKLK